ncbi:MAG: T9SS type A sorting domain-containing protein [Flavobacteriales bacterium]|nr:T9SS type A sorting domain-containing protein [Flavobacteriales bacterium]
MNKIYLLAVAACIGSAAFGQYKLKNAPTHAKLVHDHQLEPTKTTHKVQKTPGAVLWSEDFTGGFPAGWTMNDNTGNNFDWVINNGPITATYTNATPIASTSGGNHMLLFGDQYNATPPYIDQDTWFQTSAIPLNGEPSVSVRFQQKFRLCCAGSSELNLLVSTDPTFATNVQTYDVRQNVAINAQSADPMLTTVNITNIAGGLTGNIYLRFHWHLGASHYYWMIDDIEVIESYDNDIITFQEYYGVSSAPYTRIPVSQIAPVDFSMQATNVGGANQQNTMLAADVNNGLFTGFSAPTTLLAQGPGVSVIQATDSLFTTTSFTPPTTIGVPYTVTLTVSSDSVDVTPANNTFVFNPFEVSSHVYAMDDYGTSPGSGGGPITSPIPEDEYEAGNYFECFANTNADSISVYVDSATDVGAVIDVVLYELVINGTNGSFSQVDRSIPESIASSDLGSMKTIELITHPALTAGTLYFAAVHAYGSGNDFYYGTSGTSPDADSKGGPVSLIFYPSLTNPNTGQAFYTTRTPMVRLHVTAPVGIEEADPDQVHFEVYPNPSRGEFTLTLTSEQAENKSVVIKNALGQEVLNKTIRVFGETTETISLSDYSKGIYFLSVGQETIKLVVE